nr:hypothetical protein [Tanacetum cinerariifolium]
MEKLLQAPTEGYGEAIVILKINVDHFGIKTNLLQLVQAKPYHGFERENPHNLAKNFVNQFFPPSKSTHLKNEISRFTQRFEETFGEAWKRFKEMLRACPHHGFAKLTQINTFYNGLNENDQDSLNAAAGENILSKTTREALHIIENKSKVRYSRNKLNVSRMNTTSKENASKTNDRIDKLADQISTLVDIFAKKVVTPATVKAVEESCVTCGGNHAYYNCDATNSNQSSVCATMGGKERSDYFPFVIIIFFFMGLKSKMKGRHLGAEMGMKGGGFGAKIADKKGGFGAETAAKRDDDVLPAEHKSQNSMNSSDISPSCTPTRFEVPKELPKFDLKVILETELSAEQAFWSQNSMNSSDISPSCTPTRFEVPKELPKVSTVNTSLKTLKHHLAGFDVVVKERTTNIAITEGSWGV